MLGEGGVVSCRTWTLLGALLGALCVALGGCATIHNPLSEREVAALRIVAVTVTFKPNAQVSWVEAEQEFVERAKAQGARDPKARRKAPKHDGIGDPADDEHQRLITSPEGKAFLRNKVTSLITDRLKRDVVSKMNGSREARLELEVYGFVVPHVVQRATIGGTPILLVVTTLKDARTGAELAKLDQGTAAPSGQGLLGVIVDQGSLEERLVDRYVSQVRSWLLKS
jgi:hypothetical protein